MAHQINANDTARPADVQSFFEQQFGTRERYLAVHAPGRSEIAGNHTDHEGGHVIAGALNVSIDGIAAPNGTDMIRVTSKGYEPFELDIHDLKRNTDEYLSTIGITRGMLAALVGADFTPAGFDIALTSTVPGGGGLSSSAAIEAALGRAMEALWEGPRLTPVELALKCKFSENEYFGKPSGLMDQLSVCMGGLAYMDFEDPVAPKTAKLDCNFEDHGYTLCLVDVGSDHVRFTDEYAAVPVEMQKVAAEFGKGRLCEVDPHAFSARVGELREKLGDRALLRAIHYWYENDLVDRRWNALQDRNITEFLALTRASGASSAMYLQNVSTTGSFQPAMLALGLAEHILDGRGALRIHGGGFGGSIQCFVPLDIVETFTEEMNTWFGKSACQRYTISEEGAYAQWL